MHKSVSSGKRDAACRATTETLHGHFRNYVVPAYPDKIAVQNANCPDQCLTFNELNRLSNRKARALGRMVDSFKSSEVSPLIAVRFDPNIDLIVTLLGILKAGFCYLPIAPDWPEERIDYLLRDAKPSCIVTNKTDYQPASTVLVQYDDLNDDNDTDFEAAAKAEEFAVMYTSGSSGRPKGVKLKHTSVFQRVRWQWNLLPFDTKDDVCAFKASITFIDAVTEIYSALLSGHTLSVFTPDTVKDVSKFVRALTLNKVSRLYLIPSLMRNMLDYYRSSPDKDQLLVDLKHWESTGEPLTLETAIAFFETFEGEDRTLANIYGGTEMMDNIYCYWTSIEEFKGSLSHENRVALGSAVDNSIVYLIDETTLDLVTEGEVGEICISGPSLASGYIGAAAAEGQISKSFFHVDDRLKTRGYIHDEGFDRVYRTGDFGVMKGGTIFYSGRKDSQVKVRGQRADLTEIEKTARATLADFVTQLCVLAVHPKQPSQKIVAFAVLRQENTIEVLNAMKRALASALPLFMVPSLRVVERFPLLVNGKIDRQSLIRGYESSAPVNLEYSKEDLTPLSNDGARERARVVLACIGKVTGERPQLIDDFYAIGGTSINAMHALNGINAHKELFGDNPLSVSDFMTAKSILDIVLATSKEAKDDITIRTMDKDDEAHVVETFAKQFPSVEVMTSGYGVPLEEIYGAVILTWKAALHEGFNYSLVAEVGGKFAGFYLVFDHHQDSMGDVMAVEKIQLGPRISQVLHQVETLERRGVEELLPDYPAPGSKQASHLAMDALALATDPSLSPSKSLAVAQALEKRMVEVAGQHGFKYIINLNTSQVTMAIQQEMGFKTLREYKLNQLRDTEGALMYPEFNDEHVVKLDYFKLPKTN